MHIWSNIKLFALKADFADEKTYETWFMISFNQRKFLDSYIQIFFAN